MDISIETFGNVYEYFIFIRLAIAIIDLSYPYIHITGY